jgi:hypothetical protein
LANIEIRGAGKSIASTCLSPGTSSAQFGIILFSRNLKNDDNAEMGNCKKKETALGKILHEYGFHWTSPRKDEKTKKIRLQMVKK